MGSISGLFAQDPGSVGYWEDYAEARADPFAACETQVRAEPNSYASTRCFYDIAARNGDWEEAALRLERIRSHQPELHWSTLALGLVEIGRNRSRAADLLRAAADGFHRDKNPKGEVIARTNLANRLVRTGPLEAAQAEADRATAVANASGDPELKMRAVLNQSQIISQAGRDLTEVYRVLQQTEQIEGAPSALRRYVGHIMGNTAHRLGWFDKAIRHYRANEALLAQSQNALELASVRYNIANSLLEQQLELPTDGARAAVLDATQRAFETAQIAGYNTVEGLSRALMARLLMGDSTRRPQAKAHLEACVELAIKTKDVSQRSECLWYLADLTATTDAKAAEKALQEAVALADETGVTEEIAFA
ncbi:MAG: hypothetical protein AAFV29_24860, partial [Myxococcota bacterium]